MHTPLHRLTRSASPVLLVLALAFVAAPISSQDTVSKAVSTRNLDQLVRDVMLNEIESSLHDTLLWCFHQQHREDGKPIKTLEVCQTPQGDLERTVAVNGQELNQRQLQGEDQHLRKLISHPELLKAKQKKANEDAEQARSLMRMFPDAFRFQFAGEAGPLVTVRFEPNPNFRPSSHASMVFRHLEGTLMVDQRQKRIAEIDGRLTSEVKFGGGLLGHLDKGGTFRVEQQDVGSGRWELGRLEIHMSGKALLFKSIAVLQEDVFSGYTPLPSGASLQRAAQFLESDFSVRTASSKPSSASR